MRIQGTKINKYEWHKWFAWYPIKVWSDYDRYCVSKEYKYTWVWLERVNRRYMGLLSDYTFQYEIITN